MKAKKIATLDTLSHDQWLKTRTRGIGGSDASAILGLNPYCSPFDVYAEKVGLKPPVEDNEAMRQGRDFEDYVARRFEEAKDKKVRRVNSVLAHEEHPWLIGNIDRWVNGENAGLECKTTSVLNKTRFAQGEYPASYYVQCVHYMALTGADKWYLAVLVLNKGFHVFEISRDEDEINALIKAESDFWHNHVLKDIPPAPDGSDSATETIKAMFPEAKDRETTALFGYEKDIESYQELDRKVKELEKLRDSFKQAIQLNMKEAEIGQAHGFTVEWKNQVRQTLDNKRLQKEQPEIYTQYLKPPQTVRVFKIKEAS